MNCRDAWIFLAADSNGWIWMDLHGIPIHVTWISLKTVWLWKWNSMLASMLIERNNYECKACVSKLCIVVSCCVHAALVSFVAFCADFMSTHSPLAVQFEVLVPGEQAPSVG